MFINLIIYYIIIYFDGMLNNFSTLKSLIIISRLIILLKFVYLEEILIEFLYYCNAAI